MSRHALLRVLAAASMTATAVIALPAPAQAARPVIEPVPAVEPPPPAADDVPMKPTIATGAEPAKGPAAPEVTTPAGPGLIRSITAAADRRRRAVPDLIPDTGQARPLTLTRPLAGVAKVFDRLDPLKGVPLLTYRLCVKTAEVACSATQPLAKPVAADVTGDGLPDLAADLVPTARPGEGAVGLGLATKKLGDEPLEAMVWAEYDGKVSIGFDGALSGFDWGVFTVDLDGKAVRATVKRTDPGASIATVAGLTGRSAVSLRQTPAAAEFTAAARLDTPRLDVTSSVPAKLEALAVSGGQTTQVVLDKLRTRASVTVSRDGTADVRFSSPGPIGHAELRNYVYRDGELARLAEVTVERVPPSFSARYGKQTLTVDSGRPRAKSAKIVYFDRAAGKTVLKATLRDLPAKLTLAGDLAAHRVTHESSSAIGSFALLLQRNEGAISTPRGGHVTMIKNGAAVGVSVLLTGLSGFDVTYGAAPRARLEVGSGGGPFVGAASIDGTHLARLELSNTPAEVDVELDPSARTAVYRAAGVIDTLRASYAGLRSGPTIDGVVHGIRDDVKVSWQLGARSTVEVTTASKIRDIRVHASRPGGDAVRAEVEGVRKRVTLVTDTAARTLSWDADAPVPAVSAAARTTVQGRAFRAAAEVRNVPAKLEASWDPAGYRFRGITGPVGSAAIAVTNHDGAKAPVGPHLAAHYDQASGDLDASVQVKGLTAVEFSPAGQGLTAGFRAARQTLALDADVTQGDLRFGVLGRLGPVPGTMSVTAADGKVTYAGAGMDLRGRAWLGKAGALRRMQPPPALPGGVSLVDGGCAAGSAGCDQGPFCTADRGCFAVQGRLDVSGLPERVTVDVANRTFTFDGFRPKRRSLALYLAGTVLTPVPIKARATLRGLPATITRMSLGPFDAGGAAYRIEPAATLGSLDLRAESGGSRGSLVIDPVPAAVAVQGSYGARTRVRVRNSAAVKRLAAKVTVAGAGTGELRLSDVPATFAVDADASGGGLRVPAVTYRADASTLDGFIGVERGLADPQGRLGDVSLSVRDLAADTTVRLNPDQSLDLVSKPVPTGGFEVHAGLSLEPVARQRIAVAKEVPNTEGFLSYQVGGEFELGRSTIEDLSLAVREVSWLKIRPGRIPFGMTAPPALGYVTPGFEGDYGRLDLRADGVDLRPDVRLEVKLGRKVGADLFKESVRITPTSSLALRRYDQRMRRIGGKQKISAAGVELACLTVDAKPGFAAGKGTSAITLRGADGPQMVSLLDPGGQVPDYAVDLLTHFMSPFPGAGWQVAGVKAGGCPT